MTRVRAPRLAAGLAVLGACLVAACGGGSSGTPVSPSPGTAQLPALEVMLAEKVLGSSTAPVTMIEYSSLTCSHCADFHALTLPQIKAAYIDTGKVKLVYRDYPLDTTALTASMVARCSGDRFFTVLNLLFQAQATWAGSANPTAAMKAVVAPAGMSGADVDACVALTDLRNGITSMKAVGQTQYGVTGTPTFFIGNQTVVGAWPFATFDGILKSLTQ